MVISDEMEIEKNKNFDLRQAEVDRVKLALKAEKKETKKQQPFTPPPPFTGCSCGKP